MAASSALVEASAALLPAAGECTWRRRKGGVRGSRVGPRAGRGGRDVAAHIRVSLVSAQEGQVCRHSNESPSSGDHSAHRRRVGKGARTIGSGRTRKRVGAKQHA